ncbi:MAG: hypothetical protein SVM80_11600 [Halobacteriota archaeon]|nr:hypothetical protein [Halobacteriota archaeon]
MFNVHCVVAVVVIAVTVISLGGLGGESTVPVAMPTPVPTLAPASMIAHLENAEKAGKNHSKTSLPLLLFLWPFILYIW